MDYFKGEPFAIKKRGGNEPGKRQAWGREGEGQGQTEYDLYV